MNYYLNLSLPLQAAKIDAKDLTLSVPIAKEVRNVVHFRQYLRHRGHKIILTTPPFDANGLNDMGYHRNAIMTPVKGWLREQLTTLEHFACENIRIPSSVVQPEGTTNALYRPLWQGDELLISRSDWCDYFQFDPVQECYTKLTENVPLLKGTYTFSIEVPYIYIGAHREGQLFSLTLRLIQIIYQPPLPQIEDLDKFLNTDSTPPPPVVPQVEEKKKRRMQRKGVVAPLVTVVTPPVAPVSA